MTGCVTSAQAMTPGEPMASGAEGLEIALTRFGVPEASAGSYASELSNHRLLLFVHGSLGATDRAQHLLSATPATNHTLHHGASE
jgi:hypothetical protein